MALGFEIWRLKFCYCFVLFWLKEENNEGGWW